MKNNSILIISGFVLLVGFVSPKKYTYETISDIKNIDGKALTIQKGCTLCHYPDKKIIGPSFKDIANIYNGDPEKIFNFLNGNSNPIVDTKEFRYMKPVLNQLKHISKEEKEAIAKFIAGLK